MKQDMAVDKGISRISHFDNSSDSNLLTSIFPREAFTISCPFAYSTHGDCIARHGNKLGQKRKQILGQTNKYTDDINTIPDPGTF